MFESTHVPSTHSVGTPLEETKLGVQPASDALFLDHGKFSTHKTTGVIVIMDPGTRSLHGWQMRFQSIFARQAPQRVLCRLWASLKHIPRGRFPLARERNVRLAIRTEGLICSTRQAELRAHAGSVD